MKKNKKLSVSISKAKIRRAIRIYGTIFDHPILKKQFYKTNKVKPNEVPLSASAIFIKWKCHICNLKWTTSPASRCVSFIWPKSKNKKERKVSDCPKCSTSKTIKKRLKTVLKKKGSILDNYPEICKEWDYEKNTLKPSEVTLATNYIAYWICKRHGSYPKRPQLRIRGKKNCPKCGAKTFSRPEIRLYCEIKHIFKNTIWNYVSERKQIDVFIRDYNFGFELDGGYHRFTYKKDLEKNKFYQNRGIKIIRLRENKLKKKISKDDFFINSSQIKLDDIKTALKKIKKYRKIRRKESNKINLYLKAKDFQNEKKFEEMLQLLPNVPDQYNLKLLYPELCKEWNYKKNKNERPEFFYTRSGTKVWWYCLKKPDEQPIIAKYLPITSKYIYKHPSFKQSIKSRVYGNGCQKCARIRQGVAATQRSISNKGSLKDYPEIFNRIKSIKVKNEIKNILHRIPAGTDRIKFEFYCKIHNHTWTSYLFTALSHSCRFCGYDKYRKATFAKYRSFEKAKAYLKPLNIINIIKYKKLKESGKLPKDIPHNANEIYKNSGWKSWGDYLSNGNVAPQLKNFVSYNKASKFAVSKGIKTESEWRELVKSKSFPINIPKRPDHVYKNVWVSFPVFVGKKTLK